MSRAGMALPAAVRVDVPWEPEPVGREGLGAENVLESGRLRSCARRRACPSAGSYSLERSCHRPGGVPPSELTPPWAGRRPQRVGVRGGSVFTEGQWPQRVSVHGGSVAAEKGRARSGLPAWHTRAALQDLPVP